jgi:hypothetical protein
MIAISAIPIASILGNLEAHRTVCKRLSLWHEVPTSLMIASRFLMVPRPV